MQAIVDDDNCQEKLDRDYIISSISEQLKPGLSPKYYDAAFILIVQLSRRNLILEFFFFFYPTMQKFVTQNCGIQLHTYMTLHIHISML